MPHNNWFETNIKYKGKGSVEFSNSQRTATGSFRIKYDESGSPDIEMNSSKSDINNASSGDIGPAKINATSKNGIFSAIAFDSSISYFSINPSSAIFNFHSIESNFDVIPSSPAKYWVLPLTNFIADFQNNQQIETLLKPNPLYSGKPTITFKFKENIGFIEPLPDYERRKKLLENRKVNSLITAVMICEIGSYSIEEYDKWLPMDFLYLLGLATGTQVGAPWIEFRNTEGNLIKRVHKQYKIEDYFEGHKVIREMFHQNIGYLLTKASQSKEFGKDYLRVIMSKVIKSGKYRFVTIEDKLFFLITALETLCTQYKFNTKNITESLTTKEIKDIETIIEETKKELKKVINNGSAKDKILNNLKDIMLIDVKFNKKLEQLFNEFQLEDHILLQSYKTSYNRHFIDTISYLRGVVLHEGYLDFTSEHKYKDIRPITQHLHDILVRIILKSLNYDTYYQPIFIPGPTNDFDVEWTKHPLKKKFIYSDLYSLTDNEIAIVEAKN